MPTSPATDAAALREDPFPFTVADLLAALDDAASAPPRRRRARRRR